MLFQLPHVVNGWLRGRDLTGVVGIEMKVEGVWNDEVSASILKARCIYIYICIYR